jgi:hypothetical protein
MLQHSLLDTSCGSAWALIIDIRLGTHGSENHCIEEATDLDNKWPFEYEAS